MTVISTKPWIRRALLGIFILVVLAPVFGWASGVAGYAEPLDNAAEATGAADATTMIYPGLFPDYSVPGLPGPVGTIVSALIGTGLTITVAMGAGRLLEQ